MTKRTRKDWQALIAKQKQSGLTQQAFCLQQGVNPKYFSSKKREHETSPQDGVKKQSSAFIRAAQSMQDTGCNVRLVHGDTVLELQNATANYLLHLMRGLA